MPTLLTIPMAAEEFSISAATLRMWIKKGRLQAVDKTLGKRRPVWLVKSADVLHLLSQFQHHAPLSRYSASKYKILTRERLQRGHHARSLG